MVVVIALISLLVSLALPALNQARETARQAVCKSNGRQFGVAFVVNPSPPGRPPTATGNQTSYHLEDARSAGDHGQGQVLEDGRLHVGAGQVIPGLTLGGEQTMDGAFHRSVNLDLGAVTELI